jgi:hypothetical protein
LQVQEHIQQAMSCIMAVSLVAASQVHEHIQLTMFRHQQTLPVHLLVLEHIATRHMPDHIPVHILQRILVREHTRLTILVRELILVHMQTRLPVQELTQETIRVLEHIRVRILAHMQAIQFKQLKIQYLPYLSGFAPLKLYYILYIISFYGELNDCG